MASSDRTIEDGMGQLSLSGAAQQVEKKRSTKKCTLAELEIRYQEARKNFQIERTELKQCIDKKTGQRYNIRHLILKDKPEIPVMIEEKEESVIMPSGQRDVFDITSSSSQDSTSN